MRLKNRQKSCIKQFENFKQLSGHETAYRFPLCRFLGIDINNDFVEQGNRFFTNEGTPDCRLEHGDLYCLDFEKLTNKYEGIVMLQTLSWLPEAEGALYEITKLKPRWIALSSLFYDGLIESKTEISELNDPNELDDGLANRSFYNTYSIPKIKCFLQKQGYSIFKHTPFEIDIDLPKPEHSRMGTYTERLSNGKRLQLSGPLLMNWYFIYAEKTQ